MLSANSYFDDRVRSVGFERHGQRQTIGAIAPGDYHFGTAAAERMTIVSGEARIRRDGSEHWLSVTAGCAFEIAADSGFDIACEQPLAYWCEYLG
jgi:uncharacterized protein YaiE (UPF0345 family)